MSWSYACALSQLEEDQPLGVEIGDVFVAIVPHAGELFAIFDECSHGRVQLSLGDVEGCTIECLAHGSRFDLRTGIPRELPANRPVPVYPVKIQGDEVLVNLDNPIDPKELSSCP